MTKKQKRVLLIAVAIYPALSIADWMLWTVTGLSFFFVPGGDDFAAVRARMDHSMARTMLTIGLTFGTVALSQLIETKD